MFTSLVLGYNEGQPFMKLDAKGEKFLHDREAYRSKPYLDSGGVPTIAFGNTTYADGRRVTMMDRPVTEAEALALFKTVIVRYEKAVNNAIKVPMTQNEFNAMVALCYNIGTGAFAKSTLVKLMNSNSPKADVAAQFLRWNKDNGKVVKGLTNRRALEAALFMEQ